MPYQTWQIKILCYIMSVALKNAFCLLEERRCCLAVFLIFICNKTPTAFSFRRATHRFSFPAPYNTARNTVIFKISRLNAWAVLAFKSICNNSFIPHSPADANASTVNVKHYLDFNISGHSGLPDFLDLSVSNHFAQYCFNSCRADIRQNTAYICLGNRH